MSFLQDGRAVERLPEALLWASMRACPFPESSMRRLPSLTALRTLEAKHAGRLWSLVAALSSEEVQVESDWIKAVSSLPF